jgi:hypothetical protein
MVIGTSFGAEHAQETSFVTGKCKNQTKAPKRSVEGLKQAFDARLRGALPAFAGSFEPKWDGM